MPVNRRPPAAPPSDPPPATIAFPPASTADAHGRVAVGGELDPGTLLEAYRSGLFPMRQSSGELTWWSPDPRGVLPLDAVRVSRSLARSVRRFRVTVNECFERTVAECAHRAPGDYEWITTEIREAYAELHRLGWAHSVETWTVSGGDEESELVGGLYGVAVGGLFSGESMFHRQPDASKVALVALVDLLDDDSRADRIIDVQWLSPHMASLGAVSIPRTEYLARLERALRLPPPARLLGPHS